MKLKRNGEKTLVKFQGGRDLGSIVEFIEKKVVYPDHEANCHMIKKLMNDPKNNRHMIVYFGSNMELLYDDFL